MGGVSAFEHEGDMWTPLEFELWWGLLSGFEAGVEALDPLFGFGMVGGS